MTSSTVTQNLNPQSESLTIQIQRYEKEPSAVNVYLSCYIDDYNSNILLDKISEIIELCPRKKLQIKSNNL